MIQYVYIIGATGKVGSTLVKQIFEKGDTDPQRHPNPTRIVGLASRNIRIYSPNGISREIAYSFIAHRTPRISTYNENNELLDLAKSLRSEKSMVFVDVTSLDGPMRDFHLYVIEQTPHGIVTANKNPISLTDFEIFQRLTYDTRRYGYRCSVMAGAHAVPHLQELRDVNDPIRTIEGCFSGTLGYITTGLDEERRFSEVLREAHAMGYTEPHPRDDLSGLDVARKLIVLARTAGFPVGLENINLSPFIASEYLAEEDVTKFLDNARNLDEDFRYRVESARQRGNKLRYVAKLDATERTPTLEVHLAEVPATSDLGNLRGTLNALVVSSETHPLTKPYILFSQGAGLDVTAQNIRGDLLYLLRERRNNVAIISIN